MRVNIGRYYIQLERDPPRCDVCNGGRLYVGVEIAPGTEATLCGRHLVDWMLDDYTSRHHYSATLVDGEQYDCPTCGESFARDHDREEHVAGEHLRNESRTCAVDNDD